MVADLQTQAPAAARGLVQDVTVTAKPRPPFSRRRAADARSLAVSRAGAEAGPAVPRRAGDRLPRTPCTGAASPHDPADSVSTTDRSARPCERAGRSICAWEPAEAEQDGGRGDRGERALRSAQVETFSTKTAVPAAQALSPRLAPAGSLRVQTVSLRLLASKTSQTRSQ